MKDDFRLKDYTKEIPPLLKLIAVGKFCGFLARYLKNASEIFKLKVLKRFVGGWYIGYSVAKTFGVDYRCQLKFASIYSYWIISVIKLDQYIDEHCTNTSDVNFHIENINRILKTQGELNGKSRNKLLFYTLFFDLAEKVAFFSTRYEISNFNQYSAYINLSLEGAKKSAFQKEYNDSRNFGWYFYDVLPYKTHPFLLAPIALLSNDNTFQVFNEFEKSLKNLDESANYWQIQDDIADLKNDLANNILGGPTLFLIDQCKIANYITDKTINTPEQLLEQMKRSGLLAFSKSLIQPNCTFENLIKIALCNSFQDECLSIEKLISRYTALYKAIDNSIISKQHHRLYNLVCETKICERLVGEIEAVEIALQKMSKRISSIDFIAVLIRNAVMKAQIACRNTSKTTELKV